MDEYNESQRVLVTALTILLDEPNVRVEWYRIGQAGERIARGEEAGWEKKVLNVGAQPCAVVIECIGSQPTGETSSLVGKILDECSAPPVALGVIYEENRSLVTLMDIAGLRHLRFDPAQLSEEAMRVLGYSSSSVFRSRESIESAKTFYRSGSERFILPHNVSRLEKLCARWNIDKRFYLPTTAIIATRDEYDQFPVLSEIARRLPEDLTSAANADLRVLQFQYRTRGSFILFLGGLGRSQEVVAKLSIRSEAADALQRSFEHQKWLRRQIGRVAGEMIPQPFDYVEWNTATDRALYLEELKEGVLAWKVNDGSKARRIEGGALEFLEKLHDETGSPRVCSQELLVKMLSSTIEDAESFFGENSDLAKALRRLGRAIVEFHLGKRVRFVASHGDFGLGNVLVDENSGVPTGVVDWADGRRIEFPSVDRFNWLVQMRRDRHSEGFIEAVESLRSGITRGSLAVDPTFLADAPSPRSAQMAALQIAVFRYVGRSLGYPWAFQADCGRPGAVAELLNRVVGAGVHHS